MKKIITLVSILLTLAFLLTGCNVTGDDNKGPETSVDDHDTSSDQSDDAETTNPPAKKLVVFENKSSKFIIIRPEATSSDSFIKAMNDLRAAISSGYGVNIMPHEDWEKGYSTENPLKNDNYEILLGNTNRAESQEVIKTLGEQEYKICVSGNKIVVAGYNEYTTILAVDIFKKELEKMSAENKDLLELDENYEISGKAEIQTIGDTDATLRIMTFNILGTDQDNPARAPYIIDIVNKYTPYVFCMQECNKSRYTSVIAKIPEYAVATSTHAGSSTAVYTPILYRTDKLKLIDSGAEWLDQRYTKTNTKSLAWAVFEDYNTGDVFGVINIHGAIWGTSYELPEGKTHDDMNKLSVEWRVDNIRQMNEKMTAIKDKYGNIPFLWTGDFNMNSTSAPYAAVMNCGMADSEMTATESRDVSRTTHTVGQAPTDGLSIDHIFGSDLVVFRVHHVCKSGDELKASDHCAVWCDLKFEKAK